MTNGAHWLGCACQRAPEITAQAGRGGAQASPQEGAAGSFLPVTPLVTPSPITPASERLGPQSHKFLLSLDRISTARAVCQEPYNYFLSLNKSYNYFYHFFLTAGLLLPSFSLELGGTRLPERFTEFPGFVQSSRVCQALNSKLLRGISGNFCEGRGLGRLGGGNWEPSRARERF